MNVGLCWITAHHFPLVHVDSCIPPTATYLQYCVISLTSMAVGLSQSLSQWSGTVSRILSGTRQSALTFQMFSEDVSVCAILMHAAHY